MNAGFEQNVRLNAAMAESAAADLAVTEAEEAAALVELEVRGARIRLAAADRLRFAAIRRRDKARNVLRAGNTHGWDSPEVVAALGEVVT